ncbi:hypothetical protein GCM10010174_56350 [Kutzneria viridogrisea]|uniref:Uncharacterized protein n=2 Tax=Kutzneria TaxID=43356 RepID=W5W3Q7_9PSEU|nr:hypothetical protein [Kutzneria albida]AHH95101.1 hypothetical protein KALB_1730 [Kutzneria albida DSM 43870]MBA8927542.1 hypothetical protein [Kutzneria viridogrisea]
MRGLWRRLTGAAELPEGFTGELDAEEHVLAVGGELVATTAGLWLPGLGRVGWHLISKATWGNGVLTVVVAEQTGQAGQAVLLTDQSPRRYPLERPGRLPEAVHRKVTGSITARHRHELPGGAAWFVQRRVPGRDGVVLQVRADPGTDAQAVAELAARVSAKLPLS